MAVLSYNYCSRIVSEMSRRNKKGMSKYREGAFRNNFEKNIFGKVKETCEWCIEFARSGYAGTVEAAVFHNI